LIEKHCNISIGEHIEQSQW